MYDPSPGFKVQRCSASLLAAGRAELRRTQLTRGLVVGILKAPRAAAVRPIRQLKIYDASLATRLREKCINWKTITITIIMVP